VVKGDFDEVASFPETKVVTIGSYKFGLAHGHQVVPWGDTASLAILQVWHSRHFCSFFAAVTLAQRQLDVDVLVTGHTHQVRTIPFIIHSAFKNASSRASSTTQSLPSNSFKIPFAPACLAPMHIALLHPISSIHFFGAFLHFYSLIMISQQSIQAVDGKVCSGATIALALFPLLSTQRKLFTPMSICEQQFETNHDNFVCRFSSIPVAPQEHSMVSQLMLLPPSFSSTCRYSAPSPTSSAINAHAAG
jgi:hypothetical protein